MSWNYEFKARSKAAAKEHLGETQTKYKTFPDGVLASLHALIDALPDNENSIVSVKSSGHFDSYVHGQTQGPGGNATLVVELIRFTT